MNPLYILVSITLMGINGICLGQQDLTKALEEESQDALAIDQRTFLSGVTLNLKTQYPIQHAISLEVATPIFFSGHIGIGQFSRFYTKSALEFLPQEDDTQIRRKEFVQDNLQNGFVFESGVQYHVLKWHNIYAGLDMQMQQFSLSSTPQELVEEYDFEDTQGLLGDVLAVVDKSPALQVFYENAILTPAITTIQLEVKLGKRIHFKKITKLFLDIELSYQYNLSAQVTMKASSTIGNNLVENFITPIIDQGSKDSFSSFALPTVGLRLSYQLGNKIYD